MSSGSKPPKGPAKPFLGEDDLASELDAWDATFDALHGGPEALSEQGFPQPATQPAEPSLPPLRDSAPDDWAPPDAMRTIADAEPRHELRTTVESPAEVPDLAGGRGTIDEFHPGDLDLGDDDPHGQMTLEADVDDPIPARPFGAAAQPSFGRHERPTARPQDRVYERTQERTEERPQERGPSDITDERRRFVTDMEGDAAETDFSAIGASRPPSALGDLLGRGGTAPPLDDDDYNDVEGRTRVLGPGEADELRRGTSESDDDGVYTSASKPRVAPPLDGSFEEDAIAPPPVPEVRRTPAIVRRSMPMTAVKDESRSTPAGGHDVSAFGERTRIEDLDDIEARASASRSSQQTVPPADVDEDAYDDMEIDVSSSPAPVEHVESAPVGVRRTAHVLRRTDTPTKPPAVVPPPPSSNEPVIEMDVDEPRRAPSQPTVHPESEDDFSDVAAAVGADAEPQMLLDERRARPDSETLGLDIIDEQPAPTRVPRLESALDDLDDVALPTPPHSGPHTVPMDAEHPMPTPTALGVQPVKPPEGKPLARMKLEQRAVPTPSTRPPAIVDLYPRVKTPTSVPPLGAKGFPSTVPVTQVDAVPGAPHRPPQRLATPLSATEEAPPDLEPSLDLDAVGRTWPEQVEPLASTALDEACADVLLIYEREVATLDESAASAALRIEAGRLCERLADLERARSHYDAALFADPRATGALRGLRRIARASGDLDEATRHLDTEIAVAGALERRPLGHYRIDLLMASGEQDLARVAVGEILDSAPSDIRALLAQLELAFLDGRADEFGNALEQIAHAVSDNELRAAVQSARGALAAQHSDLAGAANWFTAAAESDPGALAARLGAVRHAAAQADGDAAAKALVDLARQVETSDPTTAAAAAVRAQQWATTEASADTALGAAVIATTTAPTDPLVARLSAETAGSADAFAHWANCAASPAERAYAAARAAELDPARAAELWRMASELDPGDDYAAAQLRTAHVATDETQAAIDVDLGIASDLERERARLRAAYGMIAQGQLGPAIDVLAEGRAARPQSIALAEALGEALAAAGKWNERAQLFAELAKEPGEEHDRELAQLRSAIAWEEAVGAAAAAEVVPDPSGEHGADEVHQVTTAALEAWERVLEHNAQSPSAHAAAIVLATRLGDRAALADVLQRAQQAERSPWAAASLALRRIRLVQLDDAQLAETLLRDVQPVEDPRRTVGLVMAAARSKELTDAASALEERANQLDARMFADEIAGLRLRAAQLALDSGEAPRATKLLQLVEQALPTLGVIPDLLSAARRRAGDRPSASSLRRIEGGGMSSADAFARVVRDGDLAGDAATALALYQRALELRPGDPLATVPLVRVATELRDAAPVSALALARLRTAEDGGDGAGKAAAYELLAWVDSELRSDPESAQVSLESASQADPSRVDLMHRLERHYAVLDELGELMRLRKAELDTIGEQYPHDRAALLLDSAGLANRDGRPELELADIYRSVLATAPTTRLALLHLESIVRRAGASAELAELEERIAAYFEGDPRSQAAFYTRAGETLAEIGNIDAAVHRFNSAESALPGHVPALEGWRQAALKGQLWIDVAEASARQAANTTDPAAKARLHHLAGVALMDKALVGEQAMQAFKRALDADPQHRDAFLRLRILLEEDANHDDLAHLLKQRLEVETDAAARVELHRALAELHRNFLSDRDTAKEHYRAILDADPNDLRAHAAVADIEWEQGNWQEAADALMARARLEREPEVLKTLCFRLGLIYADRLVDVPMALKAFQRALTYQPDDENTLIRLADMATQVGEWKLALGACERLVKNEQDPDRRAAHLHRVARIFKHGFNDTKRAERALNLALDGAPTNDDALQQLVQFYKDARDITSVRVHLNRVAGAMRARVAQSPLDGVAYRVIARAMSARAQTGMPGSQPIARAAAELADMLGTAGEAEQKLTQESPRPDLSLLAKPEAADVLFPRTVQAELQQIFLLLGDRLAKHVGVDLRPYGVTRGDRLRARDNPVAAVAQSVASAMGFGDLDVYVSQRQPWVMVAEPTSPISLVIGSSIASAGGDAIRFAAGCALKLAQCSLAIPARLPVDDLGVLVVALLRLFQAEFPLRSVDQDGVANQLQKLRRLIPTGLANDMRPFALAVDSQRFDHHQLARDLKIAGLRAGLVASGSLVAGLRILAAQGGAELPGFLADPVAQGLVSFALSEDHAAIAR